MRPFLEEHQAHGPPSPFINRCCVAASERFPSGAEGRRSRAITVQPAPSARTPGAQWKCPWELPAPGQRNVRCGVRVSGRCPFPATPPPLAPPRPRPPRPRPRRRRPGAPGSLGPAAAGTSEGKPGPPGTSARSSGPERPPHRVRGPRRREEPGSGTAQGRAGLGEGRAPRGWGGGGARLGGSRGGVGD